MTPDYEVKLRMDPDNVLNPSDYKLTATVLSTFAIPTTVIKMNVQFLDKSNKEIYDNGWSPRIRKTEDENNFELTYKKRYSIANGDIDAALATANKEGFAAEETDYEAQVELTYEKQTLSISRKRTASDAGYSGIDLPDTRDSRDMLINQAPDKFDDWVSNGWGTTALASARIFGPILAKRSIGIWNGTKLYIEVWPITNATGPGTEYIVEVSLKTASRTTASEKCDALRAFLQQQGWFLREASLKTQLIMDRYGHKTDCPRPAKVHI
ncbi:hypothetical protein C8A01DRAFT_51488 [Parachaetomium inaequale]|uniref:CYTH domain-containing protein n=1 Tax=Parachaetomium inaequale TaxID=2588326 RepID=A0AAN6P7Z7_9PEZI|nr:hypothetical protein C8A01DRAFT_51488 [Parachaetomium inaequale]